MPHPPFDSARMAKDYRNKHRSKTVSKKASSDPLGDLGRLPAELRNEIYRLALTTDSTIIISRSMFMNSPADAPRQASKAGSSKVSYAPRGKISTGRKSRKANRDIKVAAASVLATGLLRASKSINEEVTSILYGLNTFLFGHGLAAREFFEFIGNKGALITSVRIDVWRSQWTGELRYFSRIKRPKQIDITGPVLDEKVYTGWKVFESMIANFEVLTKAGKPHVVLELLEELQ